MGELIFGRTPALYCGDERMGFSKLRFKMDVMEFVVVAAAPKSMTEQE